jgi:drug/metabolite transporter (DMT)-like permease
VTFLVPAFGVAWGTLFLGEPLSPGTFLGAALIVASVCLVLDVRVPWRPPRLAAEAVAEAFLGDA